MTHPRLELGYFASTQALNQCHLVIERFEGSDETLKLIQRVEEALRRLNACLEIS